MSDTFDTQPKRRGRGKSEKSIRIINTAIEILEAVQPATVRSVCYQLLNRGLIPEMAKRHVTAVGVQLVWARENGHIPWEWIVDETRAVERVASWDSPEEIIQTAVAGYRKDYHSAQPNRIAVVSEKGTVRGSLKPVLEKYGVDFWVLHGFNSATCVHDLAEYSTTSRKPLILLYVGDWDPSGLFMSEMDLPERLERYGGNVEIVRIALTADDVGPHTELPHFSAATKVKDPRYKWFRSRYGIRCWELDAMSPVTLRERVEAEILARLDLDSWNHSVEVERAERESMSKILGDWKSISMQGRKYSGDAP